MSKPIEVFISYAHEDRSFLKSLETYLEPLKREKLIQPWSDADISPGAEWQEAIGTHLNTAQVILLLISHDFMASDYCYSNEMKRAMERHNCGEARVIPVMVRMIPEGQWKRAPFNKLQALPKDAKPIEDWHPRTRAYASIVDGIYKAIEELTTKPIVPPSEPPEVEPPVLSERLPEVELSVTRNGKPTISLPDTDQAPTKGVEDIPRAIKSPPKTAPLASPPPAPQPSGISKNSRRIFTWRNLGIVVLVVLIVGGGIFALLRLPKSPSLPKTPSPTVVNSFSVYAGGLASRFRVNTDTLDHRHGWSIDKNGVLTLLYPSDQTWGSMFITVGDVALLGHRGSLDLSSYKSLEVEMRAEMNGQCVRLGIKDNTQRDNGGEITIPQCLTTAWSTVKLPLDTFAPTDLHHLYVVFEVNFFGDSSATVYLRTIRYSFSQVMLTPFPSPTPSAPVASPFNVYTNAGTPRNHFVPTGFEGDYGAITMNEQWTQDPHSSPTCIQVIYDGSTPQNAGWAGVYWQDLPNNWGNALGLTGYNLSRMSQLSFWVRGETEGQQLQFFVGGITGVYGDSLQPPVYAGNEATNYMVTLTTSWQLVTINLQGQDLTHIIGGFGWSMSQAANPQGVTFYLDDIIFT